MGPHKGRVEGKENLPGPAGHILLNSYQLESDDRYTTEIKAQGAGFGLYFKQKVNVLGMV